jgi:Prolipoprotein diacylglyceryl transferase
MLFLPEILLLCLLFFLYGVFVYAKDNFILLRKNITLEQLFNISFVNFFLSILISRFVYVLEHINRQYLNPLVLVLFPYFPGLSFAGGLLSSLLILFYFTRKKKMPFWTILDIFSLALSLAVSFGMFFILIVECILTKKLLLPLLVTTIITMILFSLLSILFGKSKLKDGSVGFLSYALLAITQLFLQVWLGKKTIFLPEYIFLALLFIVFFILFLSRQYSEQKKK